MTGTQPDVRSARPRGSEGFSLVEVIVAMVVFAGLVLSLLGASQLGLTMTIRSQQDMRRWAAVQRTADSLAAQSTVSAGSDHRDGIQMQWTPSAADPGVVTLVVGQDGSGGRGAVADTLILHLR